MKLNELVDERHDRRRIRLLQSADIRHQEDEHERQQSDDEDGQQQSDRHAACDFSQGHGSQLHHRIGYILCII